MRIARLSLLTACVACLASAATFDQIVAFGDSLSDTGNATLLTGGLFPGPNYAPGRFTDGPNTTPATQGPQGVWVEQLAGRLGLADPQPTLGGGTNYAVASASTGTSNFFDIGSQVGLYLSTNAKADSSALYTIWGGANDLFAGGDGKQAANSLMGNIQALAQSGGKSFLWVNLPPLNLTPRGAGSDALKQQTDAFNLAWSGDLTALQGMGINVTGVDVFSLFGSVITNPGVYGFQDVKSAARGLSNVDPNTYLFWDQQHPTTAGHAAIANLAFNDLTATPEPSSYSLALAGLAGLLTVMRRRSSSK